MLAFGDSADCFGRGVGGEDGEVGYEDEALEGEAKASAEAGCGKPVG